MTEEFPCLTAVKWRFLSIPRIQFMPQVYVWATIRSCRLFLCGSSIAVLPFHLKTGVKCPVFNSVNHSPCRSNWLSILHNHSEQKTSLSSNMHNITISESQQNLAWQLKITSSASAAYSHPYISHLSVTRCMLLCSDLDLVADLG